METQASTPISALRKNKPMVEDKSTPLMALKKEESRLPVGPPLPVPDVHIQRNLQEPLPVPVPSGPSQGQSLAERSGAFQRKEFFGIQNSDWKSTIIVFALVLIFSSSVLFGFLRPYAPSLASHDGKATALGSVVVAIIASLVFLLVKFSGKM